jgi:multiple antibiotic resistance protein
MLEIAEYIKIFVVVVVILDPLLAVPTFINLTSNEPRRNRVRIAFVTSFTVFILLSSSALIGDLLLSVLGVSISAFRVAGGILLLLMAISMLQARIPTSKQTPEETHEAEDKETIAVVPLAIPLLAGPGSISTMIVYSNYSPEIIHKFVLCGISFVVSFIVWIILRISGKIGKALGTSGINIATRLMGLLLAAFGVELIFDGLKGLCPKFFA